MGVGVAVRVGVRVGVGAGVAVWEGVNVGVGVGSSSLSDLKYNGTEKSPIISSVTGATWTNHHSNGDSLASVCSTLCGDGSVRMLPWTVAE